MPETARPCPPRADLWFRNRSEDRLQEMRTPTLLSTLLLFAAVSSSGCSRVRSAPPVPPDEARRLLLDRNWLDRLPHGKDDRLHVYRFVPQMGGGVYQDRTLFTGWFELFLFEHTGREIRFLLPDNDERVTSGYRIERLAPRDDDRDEGAFSLRLVLESSPRGPSVYYGLRAEDGAKGDLDASLRGLLQKAK